MLLSNQKSQRTLLLFNVMSNIRPVDVTDFVSIENLLIMCIQILEEVERRREISPALVHPFMHSVMEAPFPAPGRTISVKSFLPGAGNEVLTLCRPVDSRLEHVDFEGLLQCLSVTTLLQVFASLLLERRVIFIADKLRCSKPYLPCYSFVLCSLLGWLNYRLHKLC